MDEMGLVPEDHEKSQATIASQPPGIATSEGAEPTVVNDPTAAAGADGQDDKDMTVATPLAKGAPKKSSEARFVKRRPKVKPTKVIVPKDCHIPIFQSFTNIWDVSNLIPDKPSAKKTRARTPVKLKMAVDIFHPPTKQSSAASSSSKTASSRNPVRLTMTNIFDATVSRAKPVPLPLPAPAPMAPQAPTAEEVKAEELDKEEELGEFDFCEAISTCVEHESYQAFRKIVVEKRQQEPFDECDEELVQINDLIDFVKFVKDSEQKPPPLELDYLISLRDKIQSATKPGALKPFHFLDDDHDDEMEGAESEHPKEDDEVDDSLHSAPAASDIIHQFFGLDGQVDMNHFLSNMAGHFVKMACDALGEEAALASTVPECVCLGSLCAGSGAGELAFSAATQALSERFMRPLNPEVSFLCEKEGWKQQFLMDHACESHSTCVFDDVVTLGKYLAELNPPSDAEIEADDGCSKQEPDKKDGQISTKPWCVKHEAHRCYENISEKKPFFLKSGFSRKGNSRMNIRFAEFRSSFRSFKGADGGSAQQQLNCSATTFFATCDCISYFKPKVAILENVDSIGSESVADSNLSQVKEDLQSIDGGIYAVKVFHLSSEQYMLPQTRRGVCFDFVF